MLHRVHAVTIMTSFMLTSIMQIPGGWAAQRWGGRKTLTLSFTLWSLGSLVTPGSVKSITWLISIRVFIGVAQGFVIPSVHTVLAQVGHAVLCCCPSLFRHIYICLKAA